MKKVKPGPNDDVLSLALKHKVSASEVVGHPENAIHKGARSRHVLHEDDEWTIPDAKPKQQGVKTSETATLVYVPATRRITLTLHDDHGRPIEVDYSLKLQYTAEAPPMQPAEIHGYSHRGLVSEVISAYASKVTLVYEWRGENKEVELVTARLDPVTTIRGLKARLYGMGLYRGAMDEQYDDALRAAVWAFQVQRGLKATGLPDGATVTALEKAHGA